MGCTRIKRIMNSVSYGETRDPKALIQCVSTQVAFRVLWERQVGVLNQTREGKERDT